jgi:RND superfamily putative drug exporter
MGLGRLARWCVRHRRWVVVAWVVAVAGVLVLGRTAGGEYTNSFKLPDVESQRAFDLLNARFRARSGDTAQVVVSARSGVRDPAVQARTEQLLARVAKLPDVSGVVSPYASPDRAISPDGRIAFATVQYDERARDVSTSGVDRLVADVHAASTPTVRYEAGGNVVAQVERPKLPASELFGLLAAVIILLLSFGSVIAMGLPIITALFALGVGLGGLLLVALLFDVPSFSPQLAAMIGLGTGIDYALFIVTRYRAELHAGRDPEQAVEVALSTSGRAVLFAGCTVVISLLGMFLMGLSFVRGLAFGAILAVTMVMCASVTLLPAVLGFVGRNIDRLRVPGLHRDESTHRTSMWFRWSRQVQRHPWQYAIIGFAVMATLAVPALSIHLGNSDAGSDPPGQTDRKAYDLLAQGFGPGFNGPLVVAVEQPGGLDRPTVDALATRLGKVPGVAAASPAQFNAPPDGPRPADTAVVTLFPTTAPQDRRTEDLVHHLRDEVLPAAVARTHLTAYVGGNTAVGIDLASYVAARLPLFIGAVLLFSFLLLLVVFHSIVVALKAAIMNILSIGAAYGVVVAVFQWGWAKDVVGIDRTGPIEPFIPMMLFALLFGLSMDYEVFLLSRVREEYVRTGDNALAVADGLAATARVITAAAAVMIAVFLSFVLGDVRVIKLFGLGMASAIFIDATIVRMLLVPATMELLGDANWWLPRWLDRRLPDFDVEGAHLTLPGPGPEEREPAVTGV